MSAREMKIVTRNTNGRAILPPKDYRKRLRRFSPHYYVESKHPKSQNEMIQWNSC